MSHILRQGTKYFYSMAVRRDERHRSSEVEYELSSMLNINPGALREVSVVVSQGIRSVIPFV